MSTRKEFTHKGDPCLYCDKPHDDIERGECPFLVEAEARINFLMKLEKAAWQIGNEYSARYFERKIEAIKQEAGFN